jgi:hypothetical protein
VASVSRVRNGLNNKLIHVTEQSANAFGTGADTRSRNDASITNELIMHFTSFFASYQIFQYEISTVIRLCILKLFILS